ncbi:MAG: hypothetical protein H7A33_06970 [Deltaproteobacteria bacterium]|nr:hypothetical protein [Deltaproteobacteria bacterium]
MKNKILISIFLLAAINCGSVTNTAVSTNSDQNDSTDTDTSLSSETPDSQVFLFATDYTSSGQLYELSLSSGAASMANSGLAFLGTEANLLWQDELLYILHAGGNFNSISTDNIQVVDPYNASAPYKTLSQYSVGNGTNPVAIAVKDNVAYIALYNPTADKNNVDASGDPGDVVALDLDTGEITQRWSFYNHLDDDGDKQANAQRLLIVDDLLFVLLQDLESNTFSSVSPGIVGVIDLATNKIDQSIALPDCYNPSDFGKLSQTSSSTVLAVSCTHDFQAAGDFGGISWVRVNHLLDNELSVLDHLSDDELGGYVERVRVGNEGVYFVVSRYDLESFQFESQLIRQASLSSDFETLIDWNNDIRDVFVQNGFIWVSHRAISTSSGASSPVVRVYSENAFAQQGSDLEPIAAGVSFAGE